MTRRPGWLVANLPVVMQEDDLFVRFVTIFETIAGDVRDAVEAADRAGDVTEAPTAMVREMGRWVGAPGLHGALDPALQRRIVRAAGAARPWRGTARALEGLLGAVTGGWVDIDDGSGVFRDGEAPVAPGRVVVRVETAGHLRPDELVAVIRDEVPAHLALVVLVGDVCAWPAPDAAPIPAAPAPDAAAPTGVPA
jgi:phage tail-like protein